MCARPCARLTCTTHAPPTSVHDTVYPSVNVSPCASYPHACPTRMHDTLRRPKCGRVSAHQPACAGSLHLTRACTTLHAPVCARPPCAHVLPTWVHEPLANPRARHSVPRPACTIVCRCAPHAPWHPFRVSAPLRENDAPHPIKDLCSNAGNYAFIQGMCCSAPRYITARNTASARPLHARPHIYDLAGSLFARPKYPPSHPPAPDVDERVPSRGCGHF
jgi:hypothetical protein